MLAYTSWPYSEVRAMRPSVTYTPYAKHSKEKTGNTIIFTQFEEGGLWYETREDAESGEESDDNSIMPPLISEEEIDAIDSGDESDHDLISTDMLEDIRDINKYHLDINRR